MGDSNKLYLNILAENKDDTVEQKLTKINNEEKELVVKVAVFVEQELKKPIEDALKELKSSMTFSVATATKTDNPEIVHTTHALPKNTTLFKFDPLDEFAKSFADQHAKKIAVRVTEYILNSKDAKTIADIKKKSMAEVRLFQKNVKARPEVKFHLSQSDNDKKIDIDKVLASIKSKLKQHHLAEAIFDLNELQDDLEWLSAVPSMAELFNYLKNKLYFEFTEAVKPENNRDPNPYPYPYLASNTKYKKFLEKHKHEILTKHILEKYETLKSKYAPKAYKELAEAIYAAMPALQVQSKKDETIVKKSLENYFKNRDDLGRELNYTFPEEVDFDLSKLAVLVPPFTAWLEVPADIPKQAQKK